MNLAGTPVTAIVVQVTAADLPSTLVFNLTVTDQHASGTIPLPAGSGRVITVHAYDADGTETHRGSTTIDVQPGNNPTLAIALTPLGGSLPIVVTFGTLIVHVQPSARSLSVGDTAGLRAAVMDSLGDTLHVSVSWASTNPSIAAVDANGLVTARKVGSANIVAVFGATAGAATMTVAAGPTRGSIASQLVFVTQPHDAPSGVPIAPPVQVAALDSSGRIATTYAGAITIVLAPPTPLDRLTISGTATVNAASGIATFPNLYVDINGNAGGFRLYATANGLMEAVSATFDVTLPPNGPLSFTAISTGAVHSCGLTPWGAGYCWGSNGNGQLGDATVTDRSGPVRVTGGLHFVGLNADGLNTCGITVDGMTYCWGSNAEGELGGGALTPAYRSIPTPVAGQLHLISVSGVNTHMCGVSSEGVAFCWGYNGEGELGDGTRTSRLSPVAVLGGLRFSVVSAGTNHTCGVIAGGTAYCWGSNYYGELGTGTRTGTDTSYSLTPLPVTSGLTFATVSARGYRYSCGLTVAGWAYCWGSNASGQLGDGTSIDQPAPSPVAGGKRFAALSVGMYYACGLTAEGAVYCWGDNRYGQLGDGTTTRRASPTLVSGAVTFTTVSTGGFHTCGTSTAGVTYCWGANYYYQLGDGTMTNRSTPTRLVP